MAALDLAPIVERLRGEQRKIGPDPRDNRLARQLLKLAVLDLSTYKPVPATLADANQIANGLQAVQNVVNSIDNLNFGAGKIFDLTKLMQGGASTGQFLKWDGTNWAAGNAGSALKVAFIFNGTTSYTPTSGSTKLFTECVAGGGAGGGAPATGGANNATGGGGGGGGYAAKWCTTFTAGAITVAVGAGGTAGATGAAGNNGGDTSFDTASANVVAKGGSGGPAGISAAAVAGGAGGASVASGSGDVKIDGQRGEVGRPDGISGGFSGSGGNSLRGMGARNTSQPVTAVLAGTAGQVYGGGGSGGSGNNTASTTTGGAGANGLLMVWEFSG